MIIDKLFKNADDHSKNLQERVFSVIPIIGLLALFMLIFIGILVGDNIVNSFVMAGCLIVFMLIVTLAIRRGSVQFGATIIATLLVLVLLPIAFVYGGGLYGGSPLWFVFGFAYIGLTVEGRRKYVLMFIGFITCAIAYYVAFNHPELVANHTDMAAYFDSFTSVILVSVLLTVMILFENRIYMSETKIIEKQKQEIEELSQAKNLFFSNVSHEIRTPLDSIIGYNELILRESNCASALENAENVKSASRILLTLINDVLDVSKLESGRMEIIPVEYDVAEMLSDVINITRNSAEMKGLSLYVDIDPELPSRLLGDDIRLQQIMINLINNAVKYTEEGSVTIAVKGNKKQEDELELVITVEDTGIGIKRDELPHVFEEFTRFDSEANKAIEGTGLGLVIVKQLVDQMNGSVRVNSIYTKGTTFVVTISQKIVSDKHVGELGLDELKNYKEKRQYIPSFEAPGANILVVDDDQMNRNVTAKLLSDTKLSIDQVSSGAACLEKCSQKKYDCIFMDQVMPEMDGTECLRQLREQIGGLCRETPVVVMTAYSSADEQAKFRMVGFDGYLLKPISGEMLENTLLRILPAEFIHRKEKSETGERTLEKSEKHKDKLPVLITTESICDLPKSIIDKQRVPVIPFSIKNKNGSFIDGVETETEGVLEYMLDGGVDDLVTLNPSVSDYEEFFASHLSDADNIIHISMSGKSGDAFHVATEAAGAFDNVHVVDSESLSCGMGLLVLDALELVQKGNSAQECIDRLNIDKKRINTSFLINNIDFLVKNGKVNPNLRGINRVFLLRPAIIFRDGRGGLERMMMGATDKVRKRYVKMELEKNRRVDRRRLFIIHSGLTAGEIEDIRRWVDDEMAFEEVIIQKESAAMAAMHGVGAIGLLFMYEED